MTRKKIDELEGSILALEEKLERERLELDQQYQKLDRAIQKCSEDDAAKRAKAIRQEEERRYRESSNFSYSRW
jgi:rubrerythrin